MTVYGSLWGTESEKEDATALNAQISLRQLPLYRALEARTQDGKEMSESEKIIWRLSQDSFN